MSQNDDEDPTNFGHLARAWVDDVTGVHVIRALELQKENPGVKLGEAMVEQGSMTDEQRKQVLAVQTRVRTGKGTSKDARALLAYATHRVKKLLNR